MAAMKRLTQDFKDYLEGLEKQDLLALLNNLIDDVEGLSAEQMYKILQRNGVEGYALPAPKSYTKDEAIALSIKMGGKGNVGPFECSLGVHYWTDLDTGELWEAELVSG